MIAQWTWPVAGALTGATAQVKDKIIMTRNAADFANAGMEIIDPWAVMR